MILNTHEWWEALPFHYKKILWENAFGGKITRNKSKFLHREILEILKLKKLRVQYFSWTGDKELDLEWFSPLSQLEEMDFWVTKIKAGVLDSLKFFPLLKKLYAFESGITQLEGVRHCPQLEKLDIPHNEVKDLSPIAALNNLKSLEINKNQITDISVLSQLKKIEWLDIGENPIEDIHPISSMSALLFFKAANQKFKDLRPFAKLKRLKRLELISTQFEDSDLTPLLPLPELEEIQFNSSFIEVDLSPLSRIKSLREVSSRLRGLHNADEFLNFKQLTRLDVAYNHLGKDEMEKIKTALPNCKIS